MVETASSGQLLSAVRISRKSLGCLKAGFPIFGFSVYARFDVGASYSLLP